MAEKMRCYLCGNIGFDCDNGYYYCSMCNTQADDIAETAVEEDDYLGSNGRALTQTKIRPQIKIEPETLLSQAHTQQSQFTGSLKFENESYEEPEPPTLMDFGGTNDTKIDSALYAAEIRMRYVQGIQLMIQFQCETLVEKFGVSPVICGLVGVIWLRFVTVTRVFEDNWMDETIALSESQSTKTPSTKEPEKLRKYSHEHYTTKNQRNVIIWFRSLRMRIPVSTSLAISFLACHVAREAIVPTDILNWALEGNLPYLNAFIDIGKCMGFPTTPNPSSLCPLTASYMFKPSQVLGSKELESQAGSMAHHIGLQLPPVNFHAISCRYLKQLSLPVEKILPHASRIHEWSMPPDLWLSTNRHLLPTRVCVMSLLMISIRILYNINGFGKWEESLCSSEGSSSCCKQEKSTSRCKSSKSKRNTKKGSESFEPTSKYEAAFSYRKRNRSIKEPQYKQDNKSDTEKTFPSSSLQENGILRGLSSIQHSEFDAAQLLCKLETAYEIISDSHEYSKDLQTYLYFCKDLIFAGQTPILENMEEEKIIEQLWTFYENQEVPKAHVGCSRWLRERESKAEGCVLGHSMNDDTKPEDNGSPSHQEEPALRPTICDSVGNSKDQALRKMKLNMEENGFLYIPPRVDLKRFDYLHYVRKNNEGSRVYVAHADYYILLRACARVAQVDVQYMHAAVLRVEKRLAWIENRIDQSLDWRVQNPCLESKLDAELEQDIDDPPNFSNSKFVM